MTREEALNEIKSWAIPSERGREVLETLIPELVESEDEKIRKELIEFIQWSEDRGMTRHDYHQAKRPAVWIAYLEKQKEQKPTEKQDYSGLNDLERAIHRGFLCAGVENVPVTTINETAKECLKQMKPAEWSEEDEKKRQRIIKVIEAADSDWVLQKAYGPYGDLINWLKSLRPSWKPSEAHLSALLAVFNDPDNIGSQTCQLALTDLYEQLKKL